MHSIKGRIFFDYSLIIIGATVMAVALNLFLEPSNIVIGGFTGLGIIIKAVSKYIAGFEIPMWVSNIVLNIPLFIISIKIFGMKFVRRTIFATFFLSFALIYTAWIPIFESDYITTSIFGGVLAGLGLGLIFRSNATTGGTDLVAVIIHKYLKHFSVGSIMFVVDVLIIALGFFVFGSIATMYAIISVFIITKVVDAILEGFNFAKAVFIISDKADEISNEIFKTVDRGVTAINGKGMYSGNQKYILLSIVSKKEVLAIKEIIKVIDKNAFVIVSDVREVLGEGFQSVLDNE